MQLQSPCTKGVKLVEHLPVYICEVVYTSHAFREVSYRASLTALARDNFSCEYHVGT